MRKVVLWTLLICVAVSGLAMAAMKGSADVVEVAPVPETVTAAPGDEITFAVKVDIAKTWHLYTHGDTNFIGIDLVPDEGFPLVDFGASYPAGHEGEFFGEKVMLIDGKQKISAAAKVPADLPTGEHTLGLKVTAQACDDKTCLAPAYIPVNIKLVVE